MTHYTPAAESFDDGGGDSHPSPVSACEAHLGNPPHTEKAEGRAPSRRQGRARFQTSSARPPVVEAYGVGTVGLHTLTAVPKYVVGEGGSSSSSPPAGAVYTSAFCCALQCGHDEVWERKEADYARWRYQKLSRSLYAKYNSNWGKNHHPHHHNEDKDPERPMTVPTKSSKTLNEAGAPSNRDSGGFLKSMGNPFSISLTDDRSRPRTPERWQRRLMHALEASRRADETKRIEEEKDYEMAILEARRCYLRGKPFDLPPAYYAVVLGLNMEGSPPEEELTITPAEHFSAVRLQRERIRERRAQTVEELRQSNERARGAIASLIEQLDNEDKAKNRAAQRWRRLRMVASNKEAIPSPIPDNAVIPPLTLNKMVIPSSTPGEVPIDHENLPLPVIQRTPGRTLFNEFKKGWERTFRSPNTPLPNGGDAGYRRAWLRQLEQDHVAFVRGLVASARWTSAAARESSRQGLLETRTRSAEARRTSHWARHGRLQDAVEESGAYKTRLHDRHRHLLAEVHEVEEALRRGRHRAAVEQRMEEKLHEEQIRSVEMEELECLRERVAMVRS
ncbi:unnamed protein product [Phytomonas sp. Hart1]|nr:unnamed protein product [Phytomonas sp. Hart1]|eukprot:CCW71779.1 unnamed protein product [Phytomonas sp. isolate Hart1]